MFPAQSGSTAGTGAGPALTRTAMAVLLAVFLVASAAMAATPPTKSPVGALPATFVGMLPCADCKGVHYQIDLLPNSRFTGSIQYLRGGDAQGIGIVLGMWWISPDGRKLTLDAGCDP